MEHSPSGEASRASASQEIPEMICTQFIVKDDMTYRLTDLIGRYVSIFFINNHISKKHENFVVFIYW